MDEILTSYHNPHQLQMKSSFPTIEGWLQATVTSVDSECGEKLKQIQADVTNLISAPLFNILIKSKIYIHANKIFTSSWKTHRPTIIIYGRLASLILCLEALEEYSQPALK